MVISQKSILMLLLMLPMGTSDMMVGSPVLYLKKEVLLFSISLSFMSKLMESYRVAKWQLLDQVNSDANILYMLLGQFGKAAYKMKKSYLGRHVSILSQRQIICKSIVLQCLQYLVVFLGFQNHSVLRY